LERSRLPRSRFRPARNHCPPNDQSTTNSQALNQAVQKCPPGYDWEPAGYLGGGTWRPARCASRSHTI